MFRRAVEKLKQIAAVACIALTCAVTIQAVVISVDRVEHALGIEHDANILGGTVLSCSDMPQFCNPTGDMQPVSHAHVGDVATVFSVVEASLIFSRVEKEAPCSAECAPVVGIKQPAPERPPRV